MAGCLQGKLENRLSELHATLHEQIEEVHLRCDPQQRAHEEATASLSSRAAQLGVVVSSGLASNRSVDEELSQLALAFSQLRSEVTARIVAIEKSPKAEHSDL